MVGRVRNLVEESGLLVLVSLWLVRDERFGNTVGGGG